MFQRVLFSPPPIMNGEINEEFPSLSVCGEFRLLFPPPPPSALGGPTIRKTATYHTVLAGQGNGCVAVSFSQLYHISQELS